ncbi:hypothetical protein CEXT_252011 [Caerostris extrusa]|uniref:Uncharacterized protein n=1 Tax=Caerostris extrusa TaxID=172846 RepID=A0AAV4TLE5_CAEEX|nr:hypothetical protein CEXT_252011 [Caerostris extrusa]
MFSNSTDHHTKLLGTPETQKESCMRCTLGTRSFRNDAIDSSGRAELPCKRDLRGAILFLRMVQRKQQIRMPSFSMDSCFSVVSKESMAGIMPNWIQVHICAIWGTPDAYTHIAYSR